MAKILFITSRFPYPLNKGDKLRVYFQLKHLAETHEVHLFAINETNVSENEVQTLASFCSSIHIAVLPLYKRIFQLALSPFRKLPLQVAFFYNGSIRKKIEQLADEIQPDHIHCHLIRTTEYVKRLRSGSKSLDFMDAFAKGMEKRQLVESNILKRMLFAYEKKQLYNYEASVFHFIDKFCIISHQDKQSIRSPRAEEIYVIPNGVDFATFYPRNLEKKYDLLFMGNLGYPPNSDAIAFLAEEILPLVLKQHPNIRLLIAGINAPKHIRRLQSQNIDIIEKFEDISDSIALSKIMLAPMKLSIGLQNKIIQAMAMKTPCIVSTLSNNAIHAPNNSALIEANTADEFSREITNLLNDREKRIKIGEEGYRFVKEKYSWEQQNELFINQILDQK